MHYSFIFFFPNFPEKHGIVVLFVKYSLLQVLADDWLYLYVFRVQLWRTDKIITSIHMHCHNVYRHLRKLFIKKINSLNAQYCKMQKEVSLFRHIIFKDYMERMWHWKKETKMHFRRMDISDYRVFVTEKPKTFSATF